VKPLFGTGAGTSSVRLPFFLCGDLLRGRPLGWIFAAAATVPAQVRGRLWRLPSGAAVTQPDPAGGWIQGEVVQDPRAEQIALALDLLCGDPQLALALHRVRARVGARAVLVQVPGATSEALGAAGATPLRTGDWVRVAPDG